MTSAAKSNHERVTSLCEELHWFGRGRSNFKLFEQVEIHMLPIPMTRWINVCSYIYYISCSFGDLNCQIASLLFQLLVQKMDNGWRVDHSNLYANQVVMGWSGNLPIMKVFSSGFMIMEDEVRLWDKSGQFQIDICCFKIITSFQWQEIMGDNLCPEYGRHCWLCSNVVASTDLTLLALAGLGLRQGKVRFNISCQFSQKAWSLGSRKVRELDLIWLVFKLFLIVLYSWNWIERTLLIRQNNESF